MSAHVGLTVVSWTCSGCGHSTAKKGFWNKVLGVGDFYFEVGVRAVEVCLSRRQENGAASPILL